ncbi:MAG: hypothetical protein A2X81_00285 [Desulfobacterales bacterium GWB2_56_26]|nr:MAG: hypothetical protein A2X81_00285 [Desulfobacterales bacterium GWB2_56_26]
MGRTMQCPKCNHVQHNTVECEACGVIFAKLQKIQERLKEAEVIKAEKTAGGNSSTLKILQVLLLVVVVAGTTYYFTGYRNQPVPPVATVTPKTPPAPAKPQVAQVSEQVSAPLPQKAMAEPVVSAPRGNSIERAKNATVSIEAPWGTGSGFFVNKNYIVTNRHVVSFDEKKLAEMREQVETGRKLINLEIQKIEQMKDDYQRLPKGPSRSQLAILIEKYEENLQKILPKQDAIEQRLAKLDRRMQPSDIKIILADGSQHAANYLLVSDTSDLALMSLFSGDRPFIEKAPARMRQGDKVFAIGSPVGLRHTVTAGIFSGMRMQEDRVYLQTDAAINPGNSGGPLIDEMGYVHGVTTMILRDTEGIGFAIPIDKVFEEFRSTLY